MTSFRPTLSHCLILKKNRRTRICLFYLDITPSHAFLWSVVGNQGGFWEQTHEVTWKSPESYWTVQKKKSIFISAPVFRQRRPLRSFKKGCQVFYLFWSESTIDNMEGWLAKVFIKKWENIKEKSLENNVEVAKRLIKKYLFWEKKEFLKKKLFLSIK